MKTISAVIIAKNEEVLIGRCLESVKGLDEIIVCDTGSTDKTIEIARRYTDKVFTDFTWNDNFSDARNYAKSKATGDWCLSIDCDEVLYDVSEVREAVTLAEQRYSLAVDVNCISENNDQHFYFPRLFKNDPRCFWEGAIHNNLSVMPETIGNVRIKVGYSPAHASDPERAFRILKKEYDKPNPSPRTMYYLGREHSYRREWEELVKILGKYVQVAYFQAEKADAFLAMARAYWEMKMPEDAKDACVSAIKINPNFKEACKFMADLMRKDPYDKFRDENVKRWEEMAERGNNENVLFRRELD